MRIAAQTLVRTGNTGMMYIAATQRVLARTGEPFSGKKQKHAFSVLKRTPPPGECAARRRPVDLEAGDLESQRPHPGHHDPHLREPGAGVSYPETNLREPGTGVSYPDTSSRAFLENQRSAIRVLTSKPLPVHAASRLGLRSCDSTEWGVGEGAG